jgi:hypothetical protein
MIFLLAGTTFYTSAFRSRTVRPNMGEALCHSAEKND